MRATELRFEDLFRIDTASGIFTFAGERALLLDATALGLLRKEIVDTFGWEHARPLLERFGHAHGCRVAQQLREFLPWESDREWKIAGGRVHRLQGLVTFEPVYRTPEEMQNAPFAEAVWRDSYEAEQHLAHLGQATTPVCATLVGFAAGYLTEANGRPFHAREISCRGAGDPVCRMEAWEGADPPKIANEDRVLHAHEVAGPHTRLARIARSEATVLVVGESGVGKERTARAIHDGSMRANRIFLPVDCSAIPEGLLESELFGHTRGAFSGATSDRVGLFEAARGGTLFLDEIGELPLGLQAKLLRVLQERVVRRVGENRERPVDVRIVAATNRRLDAEVAAGRFREDLYFRLRVIELVVPPLRERPEEILPLAHRFVADFARARERLPHGDGTPLVITPDAARALLAWHWPGNVRELRNALERAAVLAEEGKITRDDLPREIAGIGPSGSGDACTLAEAERRHIAQVLASVAGDRKQAATLLGIGLSTLYRRLAT